MTSPSMTISILPSERTIREVQRRLLIILVYSLPVCLTRRSEFGWGQGESVPPRTRYLTITDLALDLFSCCSIAVGQWANLELPLPRNKDEAWCITFHMKTSFIHLQIKLNSFFYFFIYLFSPNLYR